MLKIENLKKYFGGVKAVDGCSFEIAKGKITALIGPNGSGKSTIFNLISGIIHPDEGQIFFEEQEITKKSPETISNLGFSRLFQQSRLFKYLSARENLLLALDNEDEKFWKNFLGFNEFTPAKEKIIEEKLAAVGMSDSKEKLAKDLSFGQKRLVEILRAILNPHTLLILDEPAAGVTPHLREKISRILADLRNQGETILLIEHNMNFTLNLVDWVIVLDAGKVLAQGNPKEIINNPKVLEAYLGE